LIAMVTGGGGFLGSRIVELLLDAGHEVRFLARGAYPALEARGAKGFRIDIVQPTGLAEALASVDCVFHVAAKAGYWGDVADYRKINIEGTRNVLSACREAAVPRFVYTSTPSVIGYAKDVAGIADAPYPARYESAYAETKAKAERLVLAANGTELPNGSRLSTVSLRPHLIIGPGDQNLLPRVIERARAGRLPRVGNGRNVVDITYIDNAAFAHLDAATALTGPGAACAGRAYFVSNDEPRELWPWLDDFLRQIGIPPIERSVPFAVAHAIGWLTEIAWRLFSLEGEPRMTRFLASALARSHWYDMAPAKRDFGYTIRVPLDEGTRRTAAAFAERPTDG
jgi:nucleoside-diphosphate-sugar epimerase